MPFDANVNSDPATTSTDTLIIAMQHLARDLPTDAGVANVTIAAAASRLSELRQLLAECSPHLSASAQAEHILDGFKRKVRPIDNLVERLARALK